MEEVLNWCREEVKIITQQIALMEKGELQTHATEGDTLVDTTEFWIAESKRKIVELEELITRNSKAA